MTPERESTLSAWVQLSEVVAKKRCRGKVRVHAGFRVRLQTENDETGLRGKRMLVQLRTTDFNTSKKLCWL